MSPQDVHAYGALSLSCRMTAEGPEKALLALVSTVPAACALVACFSLHESMAMGFSIIELVSTESILPCRWHAGRCLRVDGERSARALHALTHVDGYCEAYEVQVRE
mmetsp:Transcript_35360/g.92819  ORF Transcript_35360/g.92819 Transcript_35360/m.92819 type:complete len:107 (-) Transcript_35360:104-424(-)